MTFFNIVLGIILLLIILALVRTLIGQTMWDRLLGFNMISANIVLGIVILAYVLDTSYFLDVALAYAILGFIGTILIARYLAREDEE